MTTATDSALAPVAAAPMSPMLRLAIENKLDVASIERLVALEERILAKNAEMAFHDAMAEFQRTVTTIRKTSTASFKTDSGASVSYCFARLDEIARTIKDPLARVGLSYSWSSEIKDGMMVVTCTVRHRGGHSQSASFTSEIKGTKLMSGSQAAGAAVTFAERYSLIQALGLTTAEEDPDGQEERRVSTHDADGEPAFITDHQAANLAAALDEVKANVPAFLKVLGVPTLAEIPASQVKRAFDMVETKRKAGTR